MYEASSVVHNGEKYVPQSDLILSFESKDDLDLSVYFDYKKGSKRLNGEHPNQGKIPDNMLPGLNRGDIINIGLNFPVYKDPSGILFIKESDQQNLVEILNAGNFIIKKKDEDLNTSVNNDQSRKSSTNKIENHNNSLYFTKTNFFILFLLAFSCVSSYQAGWWKIFRSAS